MEGQVALRCLLQALGAVLMLLVLLDVFLTVLYARVGTSVLSDRVARGTWRAFRWVADRVPRKRGTVLSFCGPVMLLVLVALWAWGLTLGAALVFYPKLGTSIRAGGGQPTPTDFVSALFAAANSMSIVGSGDLRPQTRPFKLLYMVNSLVGACMISLTLTYFMQVYSALQRRNVAALRVHLGTGETGDAAELIAGICPCGDPSDAADCLSEMAAAMVGVKETHHFYSLLMYFRFSEPYYSATRLALVNLDTASLVETALGDRRYAALKKSGATQGLRRASLRLLTGVADTLLPGDKPDGTCEPDREPTCEPDESTRARWRRRYAAALDTLRRAGVETVEDERTGAEAYVSRRSEWDRYIVAYARFMAYDLADIDPAGTNPAAPATAEAREGFQNRLRSAG